MADQEKREYNLRRLHSLLGVIPIGLFLMQHLVVNHFSTYSEEALIQLLVLWKICHFGSSWNLG